MRKAKQKQFEFKSWGGARIGAGRKPKGLEPGASHDKRPEIKPRHPVHVTVRIRPGLGSLRNREAYSVVSRGLTAGSSRLGFRIVQYAVMTNHIHLLCEVDDERALGRGIKGLGVRVALHLNRLWKRSGPVFDDRYHVHVLKTPREVRNALNYVLTNAVHHGNHFASPDPRSTAKWFDDESEPAGRQRMTFGSPLPRARTWLLARGWKLHGAVPIAARDRRT